MNKHIPIKRLELFDLLHPYRKPLPPEARRSEEEAA